MAGIKSWVGIKSLAGNPKELKISNIFVDGSLHLKRIWVPELE